MLQNKRPKIIGITGNMGSGKTTFSSFILQYYSVVSADKLAHQALCLKEVRDQLTIRWGKEILDGRQPNKQMIADIVFQDKAEVQFLNSVVHPIVLRMMQKSVDASNSECLFFEVPLLFEVKLEKCFDHIILIRTEQSNRTNRLRLRDKLTTNEVLNRLQHQMSEADKSRLADTVIDNNGSIQDLQHQAQEFINSLSGVPYRNITPFYSKDEANS